MKTELMNQIDPSYVNFKKRRKAHWDSVARKMDAWAGFGNYYHQRVIDIYKFLVTPGQKVMEIGCGKGDLLAALNPSVGVGVDFSIEMLKRAKRLHPEINFILADAHEFSIKKKFDVIILSDLINDVWDVQSVFEKISTMSSSRTRLIINFYSHLWEMPLNAVRKIGLANPMLPQNWLTVEDVYDLLDLIDFEVISRREEILLPLPFPVVNTVANRYMAKIWPFKLFDLTNFLVARPKPSRDLCKKREPMVSVIIPVRNEAGNINQIFSRVPEMGKKTELVFVEGHSSDNTYEAIERAIANHPERPCKLLRQTGEGKGDAVRLGFSQAGGDILMILDADLTVTPEDLPRFYEALCSGKGEFINGVRLVYPMEKQAMRFFNLLGNKFFSMMCSWTLNQYVKDTLCGTKVIWKTDYDLIESNRAYFGDFDPFGDFDLLFGAAKLNLKIKDLFIRYRQRTYGTTNIRRWKHGWLLIRMVMFAARKIKFS